MAKRRESPDGRSDDPAPVRRGYGGDPLSFATLAGVVALLMISFASWRDLDRIEGDLDTRLGQLESRLDEVASGIGDLPSRAAPTRRGPDPDRTYAIKTDGAPVRGAGNAPVTIAEFSDFQ